MALEDLTGSAKFIDALVTGNPVSNDDRREGDDHIRGIKNVLRNTFPNVNGAVSATDEQLNAAAAISGGAFPGDVTVAGNLTVTGTGSFAGNVSAPNFYVGATTASLGEFGVAAGNGSTVKVWGNATPGAGRVDLVAGGAPQLIVEANGNVGIGGISPLSGLDVFKASIAFRNATYKGIFGQGDALIAGLSASDLAVRSENGGIGFSTSGSALRMLIDGSGRVGIGNAGPNTVGLTVGNPTVGGEQYVRVSTATNDLYFGQSAGTIFGFGPGAAGYLLQNNNVPLAIGSTNLAPIVFGTAGQERMRIDTAGKITQQNGLTLASDPGASAPGNLPIGAMVLAGAPGGTNINGLGTVNSAVTPLTIFATGSATNNAANVGTWRNCGALSSTSTVALWVRIA